MRYLSLIWLSLRGFGAVVFVVAGDVPLPLLLSVLGVGGLAGVILSLLIARLISGNIYEGKPLPFNRRPPGGGWFFVGISVVLAFPLALLGAALGRQLMYATIACAMAVLIGVFASLGVHIFVWERREGRRIFVNGPSFYFEDVDNGPILESKSHDTRKLP